MTTSQHALLFGALLSLGCSDATAPARRLNGTWRSNSRMVGLYYDMRLATRGNTVSGSGEWAGEVCCSGTVSVIGTFTGDLVRLELVLTRTSGGPVVAPFVQQFEGRLAGLTTLSGMLSMSGVRTAYSYQRIK